VLISASFDAGAGFVVWDERGGWDPDIKVPKFKMPPGATDCHVHIYGPSSRFPFLKERLNRAYEAPKEMLRAIHSKLGVERSVVVHGVTHGANLSVTLDALFTSGGRYRAIMPVDHTVTNQRLEELSASGVRGVRFNFMPRLGGPPDRDTLLRMAERIAPLGWHVLVHMDADDILVHCDTLRALKAPILFDHLLRLDPARGTNQEPFKRLVAFLNEGQAWVKLAALEKFSHEQYPFRDICGIAAALVDAAPDRVVWGTDWPHPDVVPGPTNDGDLVDLIPSYASTAALQQKLLVENPAQLYGF